jgi:hypothetical protein
MIKKLLLFALIITTVFSFQSCKKKTDQDILKTRMLEVSNEYLKSEQVDSVKIVKIDTITAMGYAKIMLEMLENMKIEYENQYNAAMKSGNQNAGVEIEYTLNEVYQASESFLKIMNNDNTDDVKLLLFMVSLTYYKNNVPTSLIFFTTPDYKIHEIDPFGNNLLEK